MTVNDDVIREIGMMLWRGSFGERRAIGIFGHLRRGALLTAEEREPLEQIMDEEVGHGNLLRACAKRYVPGRIEIPRPLYPVRSTPEHQLVAAIHAAERYESPGLVLARALFERLGDRDAVATYTRLIAEEPGHIAWSRKVLTRLRAIPDLRADLIAVRRPLLNAYKTARAARWFLRAAALDQAAQVGLDVTRQIPVGEIRPFRAALSGREVFGEEGPRPLACLGVGQRDGEREHREEEPPGHGRTISSRCQMSTPGDLDA